jgi:NitT/TauT family transport system substrate-binding protein
MTPRPSSLRRLVPLVFVWVVQGGVACSNAKKTGDVGATAGREKDATRVKLALNWVPEPEFGGFYAGREKGSYRTRGIDLEILGGGAGSPVLQTVATGRADFGTVGADDVVIGRARGADVVAVFATYQTNPQGIMVHRTRKLTTFDQLFQGGTLAIETGQPYATYLKRKYSWAGVKVVPYDGGVARFLTDPTLGQQCYVTSEPLSARKQGADPQVFLIAQSGYNPYATVVITRRELLQKKPELVRRFVEASQEGWKSYLADPVATNALLARLNPAMDTAALAASADAQAPLIETSETKAAGLGHMERTRWDTLVNQLNEIGLIDKKPVADELFSNPG